ncbi:MAG: hypothetical protein WCF98_02925 [Synechococcus sp. ELA057]
MQSRPKRNERKPDPKAQEQRGLQGERQQDSDLAGQETGGAERQSGFSAMP